MPPPLYSECMLLWECRAGGERADAEGVVGDSGSYSDPPLVDELELKMPFPPYISMPLPALGEDPEDSGSKPEFDSGGLFDWKEDDGRRDRLW